MKVIVYREADDMTPLLTVPRNVMELLGVEDGVEMNLDINNHGDIVISKVQEPHPHV